MASGITATVPEDSPHLPDIAISRASSESRASSVKSSLHPDGNQAPSPRIDTDHANVSSRRRNKHAESWKHPTHSPDVEWRIKWTHGCFPNHRVLTIDYISNEAAQNVSPNGKRHIAVRAAEFQDLKALQGFYADSRTAYSAALCVIDVQNVTWALRFLLNNFNIDHPSEIVGMQGFSKWARYEKPRQRNGKRFPNGRSFREQTDPWRNISRTAFGLDYLKVYSTPAPDKRRRRSVYGDQLIDAKMMHLNAYDDSRSPYGYDVSVQRLSVYVKQALGPQGLVSPDIEVRKPYAKRTANGNCAPRHDEAKVDPEDFDNTNTVIVFETSASMMLEDCLVPATQRLREAVATSVVLLETGRSSE